MVAGQGLDRLAESDGVGDRSDPLDPLGQKDAVIGAHALETALEASVLVVNASAQVGDVLAGRLDEVLDRLEDPRPDRPIGKRENAIAGDVGWERRLVGDNAAQRDRPCPAWTGGRGVAPR